MARKELISVSHPTQLLTAVARWGREQPVETTEREWIEQGRLLGEVARGLQWEIGDWWNRGEKFGARVDIVTSSDWQGPSLQTCRNCGVVAAAFEVSRRRYDLPYTHYAEVAALPRREADTILRKAAREAEKTGEPPPSRQLRQIAKAHRRAERERELAEKTEQAAEQLGEQLYGVIYADPPWRFEPYSRESGLDRAADNHYPTMTQREICDLPVPAADDAVLFLWRTAPMMPQALEVMTAWGFSYVSELIWLKPSLGTGYWTRNRHEVLMIGRKGDPVAPAQGQQPPSVIEAPAGRHSEKPDTFSSMIETMFPSARKLEMFARSVRAGWDAWGNQIR